MTLTFAGRVGKAIAQTVQVRTKNGLVEKLVVNFSVAMNTWVKGEELTTWVWMAVWEDSAQAFIDHRPSFVYGYGELYTEQYVSNGVPGTQLKLNQPKVKWGPKDGNNCTIEDRRTVAASAPAPEASANATPDFGSLVAAVASQLKETMSTEALAPTPAPAEVIEVPFDKDDDPFAADD